MKRVSLSLLLFAMAAWAQPPAAPAAKPPASAVKPPAPAREPGLYATINTSMGAITVKLFEKEAPITVKNFIDLAKGRRSWKSAGKLVRRPLYPGTTFHRVIPRFMIQGGDPTGTGGGDPGYVIPDEIVPSLKFDVPGRLAMANAGPKTGNCQFFLTEVATPHLNGAHTIFGQTVEGLELIGQIARVPAGPGNKPRTPVKIVSITFTRVGPTPPNAPEGPAPAAKKAAPAAKKAAAPAAKKSAAPATKTAPTKK
jgi:cyclophilin family peptidyl-prolyl cis-trans isomerase